MTTDGKKISVSPYFIGTDPSEVKSGKYAGLRVLSKEEDYGFLLIHSLTDKQKAKAILSRSIPKDIITNPKSSQRIDTYDGISTEEFSEVQKAYLNFIIQEYVHNFEHEKAHEILDKMKKSGFKNMYFAWIGSLENNKPHYYMIHSPEFLIEYDNVGFQNDGNHIHAIFRETGNDFGEDILKQHYSESHK
jgi:pentatricopeptide repeat protein